MVAQTSKAPKGKKAARPAKAPAKQARKAAGKPKKAPAKAAKSVKAAAKAPAKRQAKAPKPPVAAAPPRRAPRPIPRPRMTKEIARAEHEHQDPRVGGPAGDSSVFDAKAQNFGQFKNKAVARLDKPINWFRRGAKPPSS